MKTSAKNSNNCQEAAQGGFSYYSAEAGVEKLLLDVVWGGAWYLVLSCTVCLFGGSCFGGVTLIRREDNMEMHTNPCQIVESIVNNVLEESGSPFTRYASELENTCE